MSVRMTHVLRSTEDNGRMELKTTFYSHSRPAQSKTFIPRTSVLVQCNNVCCVIPRHGFDSTYLSYFSLYKNGVLHYPLPASVVSSTSFCHAWRIFLRGTMPFLWTNLVHQCQKIKKTHTVPTRLGRRTSTRGRWCTEPKSKEIFGSIRSFVFTRVLQTKQQLHTIARHQCQFVCYTGS